MKAKIAASAPKIVANKAGNEFRLFNTQIVAPAMRMSRARIKPMTRTRVGHFDF